MVLNIDPLTLSIRKF